MPNRRKKIKSSGQYNKMLKKAAPKQAGKAPMKKSAAIKLSRKLKRSAK
jgi:hypothetical protein